MLGSLSLRAAVNERVSVLRQAIYSLVIAYIYFSPQYSLAGLFLFRHMCKVEFYGIMFLIWLMIFFFFGGGAQKKYF